MDLSTLKTPDLFAKAADHVLMALEENPDIGIAELRRLLRIATLSYKRECKKNEAAFAILKGDGAAMVNFGTTGATPVAASGMDRLAEARAKAAEKEAAAKVAAVATATAGPKGKLPG